MAVRLVNRIQEFVPRTSIHRCAGYMVLIPELGEDLNERNLLLKPNGLPEFDTFTIEKCQAAMGKHVFEARSGMLKISNFMKINQSKHLDYLKNNYLIQIEQLNTPFNITWGIAKTLYLCNKSLMPTKYYLDIQNKAMEINYLKYTNSQIYTSIENVLKDVDCHTVYSPEEIFLLKKISTEGRLSGISFRKGKRSKLVNNNRDLNSFTNVFQSNIDKNAAQFSEIVDDFVDLVYVPDSILEDIAPNAVKPHEGPWKLNLSTAVKKTVLKQCPNREIRQKVWNFDQLKGSGLLDKHLSNQKLIQYIREARQKQAELLEFQNYLELSKQTKMVQDFEMLRNVIDQLGSKAKVEHKNELQFLLDFAKKSDPFPDDMLMPWDTRYYKERYVQKKANLDEYFQLDSVFEKFYKFVEQLFLIEIRQRNDDVDTWHKDVKFYEVFDKSTNRKLGAFYVDPYARNDDKIQSENNGFIISIKNRSGIRNIDPLVAIIFNFKPKSNKGPIFLSMDDLKCLFFNFGQALVYLLSEVAYSEVAGLSNIEWDAVEVAGHVLESFLQRKSVLKSLSSRELSDDQIIGILNDQKLLFASEMCEDLFWSSVDLDLYSGNKDWLEIMQKYWERFYCWPYQNNYGYSLCSKSELFLNQSAGFYYKRIWAKLLAADIYECFEIGNDHDVAVKFRKSFLAMGGSCSTRDKCLMFMDREPKIDALLNMFDKHKSSFQLNF